MFPQVGPQDIIPKHGSMSAKWDSGRYLSSKERAASKIWKQPFP